MIPNTFHVKSIDKDDENLLLFRQKTTFNRLFLTLLIIACILYALICFYAFKQSDWTSIFVFTGIF